MRIVNKRARIYNAHMLDTKLKQILLEILEKEAAAVIDIAWAMTTSKQESRKRLWQITHGQAKTFGEKIVSDVKLAHRDYVKYHSYLKRLEKQNLVASSGVQKSKLWSLTKKGLIELVLIKKQNSFKTEAVSKGGITMISYDIPERFRSSRDSIREILKMFGFKQVHQSLWYAAIKVEKKFIDYLRERKIIDYVQIFEVSKSGTLEKIN